MRKIFNALGHYLAGTEVQIDSKLTFKDLGSPLFDMGNGKWLVYLQTAVNNALRFRDNVKGNDIIAIDTNLDTIDLSPSYKFNASVNKLNAKFIIVDKASDFPTAIGGIITLLDNYTYYIVNHIDLLGDRLVGGANTTIIGASSENSSLTSTGLSVSEFLFYSDYTTPIRHILFKDVTKAIGINTSNTGAQPIALDWTGVNFSGCTTNVECGEIDNFIFDKGAILGSGTIKFTNSAGTIAINNSLFVGSGSAYDMIELTATAIITRRFRIIYTSFVAFGSTVAIDVNVSATIPTENYILDTVNFSGGGTYLAGLDETSNDSLFKSCVGIINTSVNGQLYMSNNATATTVSLSNTFYKVAGTTSASADNNKYTATDNRLTNDATIERKYLISCTLSFTAGNGKVCEFGFYDSKLSAVRTPSRTKATANASGRAENVTFNCVVNHSATDYLEIWGANTTDATDFTVTDMNFVITEIAQ